MSMWLKALSTIPRLELDEWKRLDIVSKWLISTRAAVLIITLLSSSIAGILAYRDGMFDLGTWILVTLGLNFAHATNNLLNDVVDWVKGVDKDNYFRNQYGPHPMKYLSKNETIAFVLFTGLTALSFGLYLCYLKGSFVYLVADSTGQGVVYLTLLGAFFLLFYTWPLKYYGLGEVAVFLVWGILMIGAGYYTITGVWSWPAVMVSIPYSLGVTLVIFGKHIDKIQADTQKKIYTLPVILGDKNARMVALSMIVLQYVIVLYLVLSKLYSFILLITLIALWQDFSNNIFQVFLAPRPSKAPANYPPNVWPLYYVAYAFQHNKSFGSLFLLGLILDTFVQLKQLRNERITNENFSVEIIVISKYRGISAGLDYYNFENMSNPLCKNGVPDSAKDFAEILIDMNIYEEVMGILLIVGCILAVIPQHVRLITTKSSEGLSYIYLFLSQVNQFSSVINAVLLKFGQIRACVEVGLGKCTPSVLTLYQLFGIWAVNFPIYWWFLLYFKLDGTVAKRRDWNAARLLLFVFLMYGISVSIVSYALLHRFGECGDTVLYFGFAMGLVSTILTVVQWTPQLVKTWRMKNGGSLSTLMLCIQAPGSLVIVYFLVFSSQENVTTWLPYFVSALEQFVLLGMLLFFDLQKRWKRAKGFEIDSTSQIPKRLPTTLINENVTADEEDEDQQTPRTASNSSKKLPPIPEEKMPLLQPPDQ